MEFQTIAAFAFILLMAIFLYFKRENIKVQKILGPFLYFVMLRSKLGLNFMDRVAKRFPRCLKWFGYAGIFFGFIGMVLLSYSLVSNIWVLLTKPAAAPGVGLVLPFKAKGVFYVPFFYWIISIFVIAVVHEFSHGMIARKYGMKVKSSGLAFLGVLLPVVPAAFVEPDEKEIKKRPHKEQLSVFAAGPFSNIVLAFIVLGLTVLFFFPAVEGVMEFDGVKVTGFTDGVHPAKEAGIVEGDVIKSVDGIDVSLIEDFSSLMGEKKPGDTVLVETGKGSYEVKLGAAPDDESKAYLGVYIQQEQQIKDEVIGKYGKFTVDSFMWFAGLLYWMFVLNLGIGLFNLVPIGPIDGGRMLQLICHRFLGKDRGDYVWKKVGVFFLVLVLANIAFAFI